MGIKSVLVEQQLRNSSPLTVAVCLTHWNSRYYVAVGRVKQVDVAQTLVCAFPAQASRSTD